MIKFKKNLDIKIFKKEHINYIVIYSDITSLLEIENIFLELSENFKQFNLKDTCLFFQKSKYNIELISDEKNQFLYENARKFKWIANKISWKKYREKITELYKCGVEGHTELEVLISERVETKIIISFNDFDLKF